MNKSQKNKNMEGILMSANIRKMIESDIKNFANAFKKQGWNKPVEQFEKYFKKQETGEVRVYVACVGSEAAGYALLLKNDTTGAFKNKNIPTIYDFNVLEKHQNKGVGSKILDAIESDAKLISNEICLGVGLHYGYGAAQRMYVKRGYIPDGSGVWYKDKVLEQYTPCVNDDDLVIYLSKNI